MTNDPTVPAFACVDPASIMPVAVTTPDQVVLVVGVAAILAAAIYFAAHDE